MAVISGYSSSSGDEQELPTPATQLPLKIVESAPKVEVRQTPLAVSSTQLQLHNGASIIERETFDDSTFDQQRRTFDNMGYSKSLYDQNVIVGDIVNAQKYGKRDIGQLRATKRESKEIRKRRKKKGAAEVVDGDGAYLGPWARFNESSSDEEYVEADKDEEQKEIEQKAEEEPEQDIVSHDTETTEFLGSQEFDYQGRTYMHVPTDVGVNLSGEYKPEECFVPKKLIHKWSGHVNGTNKIELFPKSNHLLLSCGNDSKIYLWEVYHKRELLRGYYGHSKPIRDIAFNNDGTKFLSSSYDKTVKLWDTETGKCLSRFKLKSVANVVKFNPFNDNEFLVGLMNHKIEHYDILKNEVVQVYDHHLGSINNITFLPTKRFISSSEDKTVRVWDIHINIPIKLISDPSLHSMPVIKLHPDERYFAAQSMDNTIMVFSARDRYKTNKKKLFTGHNCAGYGIGIDISPDGRNLVSGDSSGHVFFWDWKTTKLVKKLKVDERAITQVAWNKKEVSKLVFTGSSGAIYYYE